VSSSAKHRKQKRKPARPARSARHKKPSPIATALQNHPTRTAAAVTGAVLIAAGAPAITNWAAGSVGVGQAAALNKSSGADLGLRVGSAADGTQEAGRDAAQPRSSRQKDAVPLVYQNPLRAITGLIPERIDQGVDFGGSGPIYALGDAVITGATSSNYGWPGGGWITYRLTDGPAAGLTVFVAEDVRPTVTVGQSVTSNTVIANMHDVGAGIETGWAMDSGFTAESQTPEAGSISGGGPFPTEVGLNFEELLQALGVPAANNRNDQAYGLLPSSYPADWPAALRP
jgi:hypothetical protein